MVKSHVKFDTKSLNELLTTEESCVTLEPSFKKSLTVSPIQLLNIKESIRELLQSKVTTYDAELDGIILSHKNIKIFDSVQLGDYGSFTIECIADVYLFKPTVGCVLKGIVNKKGKDHLGCLVHSIFNVSIPRVEVSGSLKSWPGNRKGIGQEVTFTVTKLDFSGRLPFIKGELIDTGSDNEEYFDEVDSGIGNLESVEECNSETFSEIKKEKKKKGKHKHTNREGDGNEESVVPLEVDSLGIQTDEPEESENAVIKNKKRKRSLENLGSSVPKKKAKISHLDVDDFKTPPKVEDVDCSAKKKKKSRNSLLPAKILVSDESTNLNTADNENEDLIRSLLENAESEIGQTNSTPTSSKNKSQVKNSHKKKKKSIESNESIISDLLANVMAEHELSVAEDSATSSKKKKNKRNTLDNYIGFNINSSLNKTCPETPVGSSRHKKDKRKTLDDYIGFNNNSVPFSTSSETCLETPVTSTKSKKMKRDEAQLDTPKPESTPTKKRRKSHKPEIDDLDEIKAALIAKALANIE